MSHRHPGTLMSLLPTATSSILFFILAILGSPPLAEASPLGKTLSALEKAYTISIEGPGNGVPIYYDFPDHVSAGYDPVDETIRVYGNFKNLPARKIRNGSLAIYLNGETTTPATLTQVGRARFVRGTRIINGTFSTEVKLVKRNLWPIRPLIAELTIAKTGRVLTRARSIIYDLRYDGQATPDMLVGLPIVGMVSQLTDPGIGETGSTGTTDGMEIAHLSSLPEPNFASFNDSMSAAVRTIPKYDDDNDKLGVCIPLNDLDDPRFRNPLEFGAYAEALGEASAQSLTYASRHTTCPALINPIAIAACYTAAEFLCSQGTPGPGDFELCVDQIEGEAVSQSINTVEDVQLNFMNSQSDERARIKSHVKLGGIQGRVNGKLRSLFVRWKANLCGPRPRANVDDATIESTPWLDDWATCRNLELNHPHANTNPNDKFAIFRVTPDPIHSEALSVTQISEGEFTINDTNTDSTKGTCSLSFINPAAQSMLMTFDQPLRTKLAEAWFGGAPNSQQAIALTRLLSTYTLGEIEVPDHYITAEPVGVSSHITEGMEVFWKTNAYSNPDPVGALFPRYFYAPPRNVYDSPTALDEQGSLFGMSFTVTTGYLNQILNARAPNEQLNFQFQPTWDELAPFGVTRPAGTLGSDVATLNRNTLSQFDRSFRGLGNTTLEIHVRPIFAPIVFMTNDVNEQNRLPLVHTPTTYGIDSLEVTFRERDRRVGRRTVKGTVWLQLHLNMTDEEFKFSLDDTTEAKFFIPQLRDDTWEAKVVRNIMPSFCPMSVNDRFHSTSCEGQFEAKLAQLLEAKLRPGFVELLSHVPAPQYFSSQTRASEAVQMIHQSRYQEGQNITFYAQVQEDF